MAFLDNASAYQPHHLTGRFQQASFEDFAQQLSVFGKILVSRPFIGQAQSDGFCPCATCKRFALLTTPGAAGIFRVP